MFQIFLKAGKNLILQILKRFFLNKFVDNKKIAVNSPIQLRTKFILRPMDYKKIIRQPWS